MELSRGDRDMKRGVLPVTAIILTLTPAASAREYFVGGPVQKNDMEIVANYLMGIEMAPMLPNMAHGADVIHMEADVHATTYTAILTPLGSLISPSLTRLRSRTLIGRRPEL
jgi:periplasmic iron binding protein